MSYRHFKSLLVLLSMATFAWPALAGDGVLLPQCSTKDCGNPNLGLGRTPQTSSGASQIENSKDSTSPDTEGLADDSFDVEDTSGLDSQTREFLSRRPSAPVSPQQNSKPISIKPGGSLAKDIKMGGETPRPNQTSIGTKRNQPIDPAAREFMIEKAREKVRPPVIIEDPATVLDSSKASLEANQNFNSSLEVAALEQYVWGSRDVSQIARALGYAPDQIPSVCQIRLDTQVTTDVGKYSARAYAGQRSPLKFNGTVRSLQILPIAVCEPPRNGLPQNGSLIRRTGNKLSVQLNGPIGCSIPQQSISIVQIKFNGDKTAQCGFN